MLRGIHNMGRIAALIVFGSSLLLAQEKGLGVDFKLRVANGIDNQDHLQASAFGIGLNLHNRADWGTLNAELGYFYKPGRQFLAGFDPAAAGMPEADPAFSADSRRNSLNQVNMRFSYEGQIDKTWSWQIGAQVGQSKFRHEYIGDVGDTGWGTYEDTYNGTPTKSVFTVSPFVGVVYQINQDSAFELNLISLAYTSINFRHTPGAPIVSGNPGVPGSHLVYAGDRLDDQKRSTIHLEIGYTFRF